MDDSNINILNVIILHGWQAKVAFIAVLFSIFSLGWIIGHRMGVDEVIDRVNNKIDQLENH